MDMEERVERLEAEMTELIADVKAIRSDLQYVRGRLDSIPPTLGNDLQYVKGRLDSIPSTLDSDLQYVKGRLDSIPPTLHADLQYVKGRLDAMPTLIQLAGFVIAIFVATGLTRFFGH
jgi:hypothetical protein